MKKFDHTGLWAVFRIPEKATAGLNADAALSEFAEELYDYRREEKDLAQRIRTLNYARSELRIRLKYRRNGAGKNVPVPAVFKKILNHDALALIDCELEIIQVELKYPERFILLPVDPAPLVRWNGSIAELLELAISVYYAGKFLKPSGESMAYSDIIALVERIFGITISRPYERKSKIFSRQKSKTPFLQKLIAVFRMEVEKFHE
jgi:hypothetical protein